MSGLFGTFNVAKRGMFAQQKAIDVTSHNIANANTDGYSRQRANMETTRPFAMPSMNNAIGPGQLGTGVQVDSIARIRDNFLDYQVRTENGTKGWYEGRERYLTEVENIMNEPTDAGVSKLLTKVYDSWQVLSNSPENSNARTVVAHQSKALTDELNNTYNQLMKLKSNSQEIIKQNVVDVNNTLNQINELNQQIISVRVGGNQPNDLMDKRDLLVDKLSTKFGITIEKKLLEGEDLKASDNALPPKGYANFFLVKSKPNDDYQRFSYVSEIKPTVPPTVPPAATANYEVTYYTNGDMSSATNKRTMTINMTPAQYKELDQCRVIWADEAGEAIDKTGAPLAAAPLYSDLFLFEPESGELKGYMSVQKDIDVYVDQLNKLAKGIALSINAVHSGEVTATDYSLMLFVNREEKTIAGEVNITAGNITFNEDILANPMKIKVSKDNPGGPSDGNRALAIAMLRDVRMGIQDITPSTDRNGFLSATFGTVVDPVLGVKTIASKTSGMTISGYFTDTINRLAVQTQEAKRIVKNHEALLGSLDESRTSISGVSLDEEMANMIQFQHAYQANAKIISTVDELLDVVINGLKR